MLNENPDKPGAKFSGDFLKELAVGTGIGFRFDITFLVIRLDIAFPLPANHPAQPNVEGEKPIHYREQREAYSGDSILQLLQPLH